MTDERNKEFEFKVGDKVKIPESSQIHTLKDSCAIDYPLEVSYLDTRGFLRISQYTIQGRLLRTHELPLLTFVERPKKYKEVTKVYYGNLYDHRLSIHNSVEDALQYQDTNNVLNPHSKIVTVTYMVEDLDN